MTSVEVPYSVAAALPALTVLDITNDVAREVVSSGLPSGIVYISAAGPDPCLVRVSERESGFFADLEGMLARLMPVDAPDRERLLCLLLGPRTEQVPFSDGCLCLGRWQRILLFGFDGASRADWTLTVLG